MKRSVLLAANESGHIRLPENFSYSEAGIVSRTVLATDGLRAVLFSFAAGQELTEHTSSARALIVALEGAATFHMTGRTFELRVGDFVHLKPGEPHALEAAEPFSMLLFLQTVPAPGVKAPNA